MNAFIPRTAIETREPAIIEVVGRLSSGRTSLVLGWLAAATRAGGAAALVDVDATLDVASAACAGVDLRRLLWVRAGGRRDRAIAAIHLLARCPGFTLLVLDAGETPPRLTLSAAFQLKHAMRAARATLVVVGCRRVMAAAADVAIETIQDGCDWAGAAPHVRRLDAVRSRLHLVRPRAAVHPQAGDAPWPRDARWTA